MPRHRPGYTGPRRSVEDALESAVADAEKANRVFSLVRAAEILGRDRGTLRAWIDRGAPVHERRGSGVMIDVGEFVRWREEEVRQTEAAKYARPDPADADELGDTITLPTKALSPKDLLALEQLEMVRLNRAQKAELVSPNAMMLVAAAKGLNAIQQAVMSIPDRLFRDLAGIEEDIKRTASENAARSCRSALVEGAKLFKTALADLDWKPLE